MVKGLEVDWKLVRNSWISFIVSVVLFEITYQLVFNYEVFKFFYYRDLLILLEALYYFSLFCGFFWIGALIFSVGITAYFLYKRNKDKTDFEVIQDLYERE